MNRLEATYSDLEIPIEEIMRLTGRSRAWVYLHSPGSPGERKRTRPASELKRISESGYQMWLLEQQRAAELSLAEIGFEEGRESQKAGGKRYLSLLEIATHYGDEKLQELNEQATLLRELKALIREDRKKRLAELGISETTFSRRYARLEEFGQGGLLRPFRSDRGKTKMHPEICNFIIDAVKAKRTASPRKLWEHAKRFGEQKGFDVPSESTVRDFVKDIPDLVKSLATRGLKEYRDRFEPIIRRKRVSAPCLVWCADHHLLDVSVWNHLKKTFGLDHIRDEDRPWVTAVMDLHNNDVIGVCLTWQPNAESIAIALRRAILFRGVPKELLVDNGKDYVSARIESVCLKLGIRLRKCEKYHGKSKPLERWFRILEERLISELQGYLGNKPANKPENVKAGMEFEELETIFNLWNEVEYRNKKSSALGDRSPNEAYLDAVSDGHVRLVPDQRDLDLLLMPSEARKVYSAGIRLFGFYYWNDLLTPFINDTAVDGTNRKLEVAYDPTFLGEVLVFVEGKFLCVAKNEPLAEWSAKKEDLDRVMHKRRYARNFIAQYLEAARIAHSGQELLQESIQERLEREQAAQQQLQLPEAVGQGNNLRVMIPKYTPARQALERGEGRSHSVSNSKPTAARHQPEECLDFETPDANGVPRCEEKYKMRKRYRERGFLVPLDYLDLDRPLREQIRKLTEVSADVVETFRKRGLYAEGDVR